MVSTSPHSTTIRTPTLSRSSSRTIYLYTAWQLGISLKRKFSRLVNYANDSGGDIYYAVQSAAMERLYSRITEQARHEYTLAYVPHVNNRNASYHKVEVHTTRESFTIRTRQGYYTGPLVVPAKQ